MKLYTVEQRRARRQQRAANLVDKDKLTRAQQLAYRRGLLQEQELATRAANRSRRENRDTARKAAKKPEDGLSLSAGSRFLARPALRAARKIANAARRADKKITAMLSEDRKRSYLATYTAGVKAARELKRTLRAYATVPAEAVTNETR
jgi:hypothetical protein